MSHLTSEQIEAITHAWLDCMSMANIGDADIDLGSLADAASHSMQELEDAFPFLAEKWNGI